LQVQTSPTPFLYLAVFGDRLALPAGRVAGSILGQRIYIAPIESAPIESVTLVTKKKVFQIMNPTVQMLSRGQVYPGESICKVPEQLFFFPQKV
jgi:hypothetical protein